MTNENKMQTYKEVIIGTIELMNKDNMPKSFIDDFIIGIIKNMTTNGDQILELMQKLNRELKTTFIFSTHDQKIVNMATQVIKIRDGKLYQQN